MPVVRICPRCRKGFLKSTYQMIEHIDLFHSAKARMSSEKQQQQQKQKQKQELVVGNGKDLYRGKFGSSIYEPDSIYRENPVKTLLEQSPIKSVEIDTIASNGLMENPQHFGY